MAGDGEEVSLERSTQNARYTLHTMICSCTERSHTLHTMICSCTEKSHCTQ
uniref:Uncharacterized protein n=1 Tax=Arundo donax TaxID=35708 RepID=A0A0A8ZZP7_ARUDO